MPLVYIFFNGTTAEFPPSNDWEKFPPNYQEIRLFNIAAASWEAKGFEVRRLHTFNLMPSERINYLENGAGPAANSWYPREYWQLLAAARVAQYEENKGIPAVISSLDVINQNYTLDDYFQAVDLLTYGHDFINFQDVHFSLGAFVAGTGFYPKAFTLLSCYDAGGLGRIESAYVSDERILRDYHGAVGIKPYHTREMSFTAKGAKLYHAARSTLAETFNQY